MDPKPKVEDEEEKEKEGEKKEEEHPHFVLDVHDSVLVLNTTKLGE